jgi:LacI family transcriptional regulator
VLRRREAFAKAIKKGGGECKIYEGEQKDFSRLAKELLAEKPQPTAVFAATDLIAMKLYVAAAEAGLKIPDDVSIVGYADFPFSEDLVPALTTVRQDPYQIGCVAARILLDRVLDRATDSAPQKVRLRPEAIIRKSTGPAR